MCDIDCFGHCTLNGLQVTDTLTGKKGFILARPYCLSLPGYKSTSVLKMEVIPSSETLITVYTVHDATIDIFTVVVTNALGEQTASIFRTEIDRFIRHTCLFTGLFPRI